MEKCELSITIPATGNAYPLVLPAEPIQIFTIAQKKPLYSDSLSYHNRPMRGKLLGTPLLMRNSSWTHTFICLMDEIYTFEVACGKSQIGDCSLRWTQDKEHESFPGKQLHTVHVYRLNLPTSCYLAILMTQFSTI